MPITWIESNLTKETLFASFQSAVEALGPVAGNRSNDQGSLYAVKKTRRAEGTAVLLDYARSSRGVFLPPGLHHLPFREVSRTRFGMTLVTGMPCSLRVLPLHFSVTQSSLVGNQTGLINVFFISPLAAIYQ